MGVLELMIFFTKNLTQKKNFSFFFLGGGGRGLE